MLFSLMMISRKCGTFEAIYCNNVVFSEPLGPIIAVISPKLASIEICLRIGLLFFLFKTVRF